MKSCVDPVCKDRERIMPDGSCKPCEPFTVSSLDKKECIEPVCDYHMKILENGSC